MNYPNKRARICAEEAEAVRSIIGINVIAGVFVNNKDETAKFIGKNIKPLESPTTKSVLYKTDCVDAVKIANTFGKNAYSKSSPHVFLYLIDQIATRIRRIRITIIRTLKR